MVFTHNIQPLNISLNLLKMITEQTFNLFEHREGPRVHVLALLLDDEEEQREKVSIRVCTRPQISRRKSEGVFFTIFQELMKEGYDGFVKFGK